MNLPRPSSQVGWWLAFATATLAVPVALVSSTMPLRALGLMVVPIAMLLGPLLGCYLLAVSRTRIWAKLFLIPAYLAALGFFFMPRASCSDERSSAAALAPSAVVTGPSQGCDT